jgi:hypothetical protein
MALHVKMVSGELNTTNCTVSITIDPDIVNVIKVARRRWFGHLEWRRTHLATIRLM